MKSGLDKILVGVIVTVLGACIIAALKDCKSMHDRLIKLESVK